MKIKTALISVSDKKGLAEFAKALSENGVKIISSGGTYKALHEAGIKCAKVEDVTGFPEMLEGRLKTIHPKLHGGILAKRNRGHLAQLKKHGIETIDLVVVNLYPFRETVSKKGVKLDDAVENIDIGGPALIRAAAKNHESVGVVVEPGQYAKVLEDLRKNGFGLSDAMRKGLCVEAFQHTAFYDSMVSSYLAEEYGAPMFPEKFTAGFERAAPLRYGENPHQKAVLYKSPLGNGGVLGAKQLNGKELSYNNYLDADTAISIVSDFREPCAAVIKHNNPCGAATAKSAPEAFRKACESDKLSSFGGIIALNRKCDLETARRITSFFNEVVIAPAYDAKALEELRKKPNLRVLELHGMEKPAAWRGGISMRTIHGGMLAQEPDSAQEGGWKNVSGINAHRDAVSDLEFAWKIVRHVKSNAIVLAKGGATVGIGMGLTSRVDAVELAISKAGERAKGAALASDAFFPFRDSIELCAKAGVAAIVEPGGSVRDAEVTEEAKKYGMPLFFTGFRHFKH